MENKIKVKELAAELKMDTQDVLRDIHSLSIVAKNSMSALSDADVVKIRHYYKTEHNERSTMKTEGGVIVRRRRQADINSDSQGDTENFAEKEEALENAAEKSSEAQAGAKPAKKQNEDGKPKEKAEEKKVVKTSEKASEKANEKPKAKTAKKHEVISTPARVIQAAPKIEPKVTPAPVIEETETKVEVEPSNVHVKVAENTPEKEVEKAEKPAKKRDDEKKVTRENVDNQNKGKNDPRRPAAVVSAKPDGSSTQSLLPPAGERSFAQRIEPSAYTEAPRSHVRVISKPVAQAEPTREFTPRDNRDNRDNRPRDNRSPRPPFTPRPDQKDGQQPRFDNRPTGDKKFENRDNRPSRPPRPDSAGKDKDDTSRARPQRPIAPKPRPTVEGLFPVQEEQSRKKKNKNKRGADFQTEPAHGQDFKGARFTLDFDDDAPRRRRKSRKKEAPKQTQVTAPMKAAKRKLRIDEAIRVSDMAHQMGLKASEIIKILFGLGVMATINSSLDIDTATVVAAEFDYEVEKVGFSAEDAILPIAADKPEQLKPRPPVVTIMGHVDHGKTSLLDAIRKTNVTAGEAGGITQHIGAYHVKTKRGEVVFLDTPGHEAFTAMRLRGAQVTDLVILVVAADDGVMEQTREAINHAKAASVPIIVAINKMDKEGANTDRVMRELAELGLQSEEWGGDTVTAKVSAKKREGLDELLELVLLQAEIMELKANPEKQARGHIVEAKLDKGRGPVASVLIQEGTIQQGDAFVCGVFSGRVRALFNDQGKKIQKAGPSMPVEVQGFEGVPEAGEEFICMEDEKMARRIADSRSIKQREKELAKESRVTLETFLSRKANVAEAMVLNLIIKADVQGSLEAITDALNKLSTEKVRINVLHGGAGSISESDIMLAAASEAIIIGFNVRPTAKVKEVADDEKVDIRFYDIIYKLVEEIRFAMAGLLAPVQKEVYLGQAEVRNTFNLPKIGTVAGAYISDGKVLRNAGVRLLRDGIVIYTGKITSLKRFKDDAKEVLKGFECGISLENYNDIKIADIIEAFEMKEEVAVL